VIELFEGGHITSQIVEGQRRSDEAEKTKKMRLGYMGHLTLVSEEVVRFTERQSPEQLSPSVMEQVLHPDWVHYVENALSETRERESAILGGVKPDVSMCHRQAVLNAISNSQDFAASSALANAGLNGGMSNSAFEGFDFMSQGTASGGAFGFSGLGTGTSSLLSGFGGSSDDEDEDMEDPEDDVNRKGSRDQYRDGSGADNVGVAFFEDVDMLDA
jgi:SIT4-associating protein SAP185/190